MNESNLSETANLRREKLSRFTRFRETPAFPIPNFTRAISIVLNCVVGRSVHQAQLVFADSDCSLVAVENYPSDEHEWCSLSRATDKAGYYISPDIRV
jgi:hypothetical protein